MKNIFSKLVFASLPAITLMGVVGCANNNDAGEKVTIIDMEGTSVTINKNPKKVACCRSAYDLLVAFGLGDNIDGVDKKILANPWTSAIYPSSSKHFAYEYENSYELYMSRGVDLVFSPEKRITDDLRAHGINAVTVKLYGNPTFDNSIHSFSNMIAEIWPDAGVKSKVTAWNDKLDKAIADVAGELAKHEKKNEKLFYVRGDKDKGVGYTDTKGCFAEFAYRTLGFNCMSSILDSDSNKVSAEAICEFNPDVFVMGGIYQSKNVEAARTTEPYSTLDAVKNDRIYTIPVAFTQLEQLNALSPEFFYDQANKLYPDYFDYDVGSMFKSTIEDYFGVELTDAHISNMMNGLGPDGGRLY